MITGGLFGAQAELAEDPVRLERLFRANFTGTALLCQQAAARLAERGGGVICAFSSVAGERARKTNYLYGASKAGLSAFLDGLGLAYADRDVRVVCVKPGFVRTEMTAGLPVPPFAGEPDAVAGPSATRNGRRKAGRVRARHLALDHARHPLAAPLADAPPPVLAGRGAQPRGAGRSRRMLY